MIFKTFNNDLDGIANKIGFSSRSFAEWGNQVSHAFNNAGKGLKGFKSALYAAFNSTYTSPPNNISLINQSDFSTVFNTKNAESFFHNFNVNGSKSLSIMTRWCDGLKVTDKTMKAYLSECMQNQVPASFEGYNRYVQSAIASNKQFSLSAKLATAATNTLKLALNAITFMVIVKGVQFLVDKFSELANAEKHASENANELYNTSNEIVQKNKEETNSLTELISKYKELKNNGDLDLDTRKEIKVIQNDIAELVGSQAKNLDLVNGKLDDELQKLNKISEEEAKRALQNAEANYYNAKDAGDKAIGNSKVFFEDYDYSGKVEPEAKKILEEAGFGVYNSNGHLTAPSKGGFGQDGIMGSEMVVKAIGDSAKEKYDYLQQLITVLEENGQKNTDIYKGLITQAAEYDKYSDNEQTAATDLVNTWLNYNQVSNENLKKINVNSVESFEKYRQKMISELQNDESIGEILSNGILSKDDLETSVNDFMSTASEFSNWYKQWKGIISDSNSNISKIKSISEALSQSNGKEDGTYADDIEDYKDKLSSLKSCLDKLRSGDYTPEDLLPLADKFNITGDTAEERISKVADLMQKETKKAIAVIDGIISAGNLDDKVIQDLEEYKGLLQDICDIDISGKITLSGNALADVQKLSGGLDQLDKIYSDILDKEDFDWSSILNNADFTKTFSAYTKEYKNFINTVSSSPDDINACQSAFNNLVSAYIYGSGVLDEVTEATKAGTIAMLEQMGVSNAAAIVELTLARNEELRKYETLAVAAATEDMADKTNNVTKELLQEADMSTYARKALFELVTQQTIFANQDLGFREKINGLKKLAGAYMSVANARMFKKTLDRNIESNNLLMRSGQRGLTLEEIYQKTYDQLSDKLFPDVEIPEPEIIYTGGSTTRDTIENIRKEQEQAQKEAEDARKKALEEAERKKKEEEDSKEQFDWMAIALDKLSSVASKARDKIDDLLTFGAKKRQTQKAIEKTTKAIEAQYRAMKKYKAYALEFSAGAAKETTELVTETVSNAASNAASGIASSVTSEVAGAAAGVVNDAMQYVGKLPYVWGGTSLTSGADCSGFVQQLYKKYGVNLGRTTWDQIRQGTPVDKRDLQPGDLVFFGTPGNPTHVGLYAGNGQFIHEPGTGETAKVSYLSSRTNYIGARRFSGIPASALSSDVSSPVYDTSSSEITYIKTVPGIPKETLAKYRKKVREGGFDVGTIRNEKLKNAIKTYQEWWEKVQACKDEINSLNSTLKELYRTMAEIPLEKRDKKAESIDSRTELLESRRENADGITVSKKKFRQTNKQVKKSGNAVKRNIRTKKQKNASGLTKQERRELDSSIRSGKAIPQKILDSIDSGALYDSCRGYNDAVYNHSLYAETAPSLKQNINKYNSLTNKLIKKENAKEKVYRAAYGDASKGYSESLKKVSSSGSDVKKILNDGNTKIKKNVIKKIKNCIRSKKEIPAGLLAQFDQSGTFVQTCLAYNRTIMQMNAEKEVLKTAETDWKQQQQDSIRQIRERKIEKRQNRADKIQEKIDRNNALAENEVLPKQKNKFLKKNLKLLKEFYKEQIKIAKLEGNSVEAERLKAEWIRAQRDNKIEQHQNNADYYQSKIDRNEAIAGNRTSAKEKNEYLKDSYRITGKRYDELIRIAEIGGDLVEADTLHAQKAKDLNDIRKQIYQNLADEHAANTEYFQQLADISVSVEDRTGYRMKALDELKWQYLNKRNAEFDDPQEQERLDAELQGKIGEYYKTMFDDIRTEYEQQISLVRNDMADLDNEIKKTESSGRRVDASFYQHKISMGNEILAKLKEEESGLRERLADVKMYSSEWYEVQDAIQNVQDAQADSLASVKEYKDAVTEIANTIQDDIVSAFHDINNEAGLLITLLGDNLSDSDPGTLTQDGLAALSLYVSQMEVSKKSAASLHDTIQSMQEAADKGILSFLDANGIQRDYASVYELKEDIGDLYSSYRDEIKSTYDYESGIVDLMKQKYQAESDYLKDLTEKKKESLNLEKD